MQVNIWKPFCDRASRHLQHPVTVSPTHMDPDDGEPYRRLYVNGQEVMRWEAEQGRALLEKGHSEEECMSLLLEKLATAYALTTQTFDEMDEFPEIQFVLDRYADWISEYGTDWHEARQAAKYGIRGVVSVLWPAVTIWKMFRRLEADGFVKHEVKGAICELVAVEGIPCEKVGGGVGNWTQEDVDYCLRQLYTALNVSKAALVGDEGVMLQNAKRRARVYYRALADAKAEKA
jgi:hypothetical protein